MMKIMTLNTHSLMEESYESKCRVFADAIEDLLPDVIALQEVNQKITSPPATHPYGIALGKIPLKSDNHILKTIKMLKNTPYYFVWGGIKLGYGKMDEGLAIMSRHPITEAKIIPLSKRDDYKCWETRKALLVKTKGIRVCCVHLGRFRGHEDGFFYQFQKLNKALKTKENTILAGDFNCPDTPESPGYSLVTKLGWQDAFLGARERKGYCTVRGTIDGWQEGGRREMRIDYIFTGKDFCAEKSETIFDGTNYQIISDHFGVISVLSRGEV